MRAPAPAPVPGEEGRGSGFWSEFRDRYFIKKSLEGMKREAASSGLKRTLTARDLTALGVGAIIGAGIFAVVGEGAARAGPAVAVSFLIAALASGLAALAYAELAAMIPLGGSAYTYAYTSMGEMVAWLIAWNLVLEYAIGNMAVAASFSDYLENLMQAVGIHLPQWLTTAPHAATALEASTLGVAQGTTVGGFDLPAFLVVIGITMLLVRGTREAAESNFAMVVFKLGILVAFIVVAVWYVEPENLNPFAPFGSAGILQGAALMFFAFIGFDAISTVAEDAKNPQRDLPIGILASLAICTVIYLAVALVLTGVVPFGNLAGAADPMAVALSYIGMDQFALVISAGAVVATLSVLLVFQLGTTRIFFSLARDGLFPKRFAKVHRKYRTPHMITWGTGLFVAFFAAVVPIGVLVELTNIGTFAAFIIVMLGVIILRRTQPDAPRPFRCPAVPWVPMAGIAVCLLLVANLPPLTWLRFAAWMGIGLMVYGFYGARRSTLRQQMSDEAGAPATSSAGES